MTSTSVLAQSGASTIADDSGGPYVIAAYVVFLVLVVVYVAIMAQRLTKISKAAAELEARLDAAQAAAGRGAGAVQSGDDVHGEDPATIAPAAPLQAEPEAPAGSATP